MCLRAFYKLHRNLSVSSAAAKVLWCLGISVRGIFPLQIAVLSANFGSTGRLHYFSAVRKVRAHASYMDVVEHHCKTKNHQMSWFDKDIYWETSAINFMVDKFNRNDAIATKALQKVKRNRYYLSPVTIWEILLTSDSLRREQIIFFIQNLFHDQLLNSPSEFIVNFIDQGCPLFEKKYDFHSKLPIAKTWNNICQNEKMTFILDHQLLKDKSKHLQDISKKLSKIINRIVLDITVRDTELQLQELLNNYHRTLKQRSEDNDSKEAKIEKIAILFLLYIFCMEVELDSEPIKKFWIRHKKDDIIERLEYLLSNFEILVHRGPFVEMALMAYTQISQGVKSNRGLFFDCLHCVYLTYIDFFITKDDHFVKLRNDSEHILFSRIYHIDEVKLITQKRDVYK